MTFPPISTLEWTAWWRKSRQEASESAGGRSKESGKAIGMVELSSTHGYRDGDYMVKAAVWT